jgi:hypothetical protein
MARDRDIRAAIRDALLATNAFDADAVYLSGLPEDRGQSCDDRRACSIEPFELDFTDVYDGDMNLDTILEGRVTLTFMAREEDPQARDEAAEALLLVGVNTLSLSNLAGLTFPAFSRFNRARFLPAKHPERRVRVDFTYKYCADVAFDTSE